MLQIAGSTTVNLPVAEAAEILRAEQGWKIFVDTMGGSSGGINSVATGLVDLGMSSKPLTPELLRRYPGVDLQPYVIGYDAVALVVSHDVWKSGIRQLDKRQVARLYEGKFRNWQELGGLNQRIAFFNKEPGRGTWEVFVSWLYGDPQTAPLVDWPQVGGNEEARNKVRSTPGSITQLSSAWADGQTVFALALETENGDSVAPTPQSIADDSYPVSRPLLLVTRGTPEPQAREFIEFMLGPRGQALLPKHGYIGLKEVVPE